jgi:hypothetical protein
LLQREDDCERFDAAITAALDFVLHEQHGDGSYATLVAEDRRFAVTRRDINVFFNALILAVLSTFKERGHVATVASRLATYICGQRSGAGFWTFWGTATGARIPADLDDTAAALYGLHSWSAISGTELSAARARIMECRESEGLFATWIRDTERWRRILPRAEIDPTVNANVFHFLEVSGDPPDALRRYLAAQVIDGDFERPSRYYESPAVYLYFLSNSAAFRRPLIADHVAQAAARQLDAILQAFARGERSLLEASLATTALLRIDPEAAHEPCRPVAAVLRDRLLRAGRLEPEVFFRGVDKGFYGSPVWSTLVAAQALHLYRPARQAQRCTT